ncbi:glycosyl transferase 4-like domain protein [Mycobacterium xenopi 3993]|nr:glycosyl transferase 4-like domain protein [Mycobacterium xenopi 3993]
MLSVHTSPLAQPGIGDAGGMNVYVLQTALHLPAAGWRWRSSPGHGVDRSTDGAGRARGAGPQRGGRSVRRPRQIRPAHPAVCVRRRSVARRSGPRARLLRHRALALLVVRAGRLAGRDRWAVPLVHTAHTLAAVKNAALAEGDTPEPPLRTVGEQQVVDEADRLIVNTNAEAGQLVSLHSADPSRIDVAHPGWTSTCSGR